MTWSSTPSVKMNSKLLYFFATVLVCVNAESYRYSEHEEGYPISGHFSKRHPRDVTWDKQVGGGKVFGTLGQNDDGLFGKAGYNKEIFNDDRGKLTGQAYGTRVLGPAGDSTNYGGRLDWANKNAEAAIDINRQIGGRSGMTATGSGVWDLDKNTRLSAGGMVSKEFGHRRPDVGVQAEFRHDW